MHKSNLDNAVRRALALLLIGTAIWGFTPVFVRWAGADPAVMVFSRTVVATMMLSIWYLIHRRRIERPSAPLHGHTPQQPRPPSAFLPMLLSGVGSAGSNCCFAAACHYAPPENVYTVFYSFPFWLMGYETLVERRRLSTTQLSAVTLALVGAVILGIGHWKPSPGYTGEMFALLGALCWVTFSRANQYLPTQSKRLASLCGGQLMALIVITPFALPRCVDPATAPSPSQLLPLLLLGLGAVLPVWAWSQAIRHIPVVIAGIIAQLECVIGVILFFLIFGVAPSAVVVTGGGVIIVASAIACSSKPPSQSAG